MVKVISLSNEAYNKLKMIKGNKSFSETILETIENKKKKNILEFFGVLKNKEEWARIKKELEEDRKKFKSREFKL